MLPGRSVRIVSSRALKKDSPSMTKIMRVSALNTVGSQPDCPVSQPAASSPSPQVAARPVRLVFVVGGLYKLASGVAWIMRDLAAALGRAGTPVDVYAADCIGRESIGHIFQPPTRWVTAKGLWLG